MKKQCFLKKKKLRTGRICVEGCGEEKFSAKTDIQSMERQLQGILKGEKNECQ